MHHCFIIPPHMLLAMAQSPDPQIRQSALATLGETARLTGQRDILGRILPMEAALGHETKVTFDARNSTFLPGVLAWQEGGRKTGVVPVDEATDAAHQTSQLLAAFGRQGLDNHNLRLTSTVRYGRRYANAYWNGRQMVYGDGDGVVFNRFTIAPDIPGHELSHGLTQFTCGLQYMGESGALNEHFSDVMGVMVNQFIKGQAADQADWLVGKGIFTPRVRGRALRDMMHPGTAYDDPNIGKDPQPDHYSRLVKTDEDNGGVHLNSGIPNRAFALAAVAIGGKSWEGAGLCWFKGHTAGGVQPFTDFRGYAAVLVGTAERLWGAGSARANAVAAAWQQVGVL
jgi:Zn-dependent metalloprotease